MGDNRRPIKSRDVMYPARIAANLIEDYVAGSLTDYAILFKAVVVAIDTVGGTFSGPGTSHDDEPLNPKNSIKARIVSKDRYKNDDDLTIFWPMFSHDLMPIKIGEYVYILFESPNEETRGLWLGRAPQPKDVTNENLTLASDQYKNSINSVGLDKSVADTEVAPNSYVQPSDFSVESVQPFTARVGDRVIEGSNNTIVILGRDRPTDVASGEQQNAGSIQMVAGRSSPEDLDIVNDNATLYIAMKSDIDANFGTDAIGAPGTTGVGPVASIGLTSDEIRIVARKGMKIVVSGGDLVLEGANIIIGDQAVEPAVLGTALDTYLKTVVVNTPAGPGTLTPPPPTILSQTVKVKS
jgi:hypothetical protein